MSLEENHPGEETVEVPACPGARQKWQLALWKKPRCGWRPRDTDILLSSLTPLDLLPSSFRRPLILTLWGDLRGKSPRVSTAKEVGIGTNSTRKSFSVSQYGLFPFCCPKPSLLLFIWPSQQNFLTHVWCGFWTRTFCMCMKWSKFFTLFFLIGLKSKKIQQNDRCLSFWCYPP